jgi:carboxyl-terminal processing protease
MPGLSPFTDPRSASASRRRRRSPLLTGALIAAALLAVVLPALFLGIYLGGHPDKLPNGLRDKLVGDGEAQTLDSTLDLIERDYFRKVPRGRLFDQSLSELVGGLRDQFSSYYSPKDYSELRASTSGRFAGIGLTVAVDRRGLKINSVYRRSPADRAGLKAGDLITRAAGRSLAGRSTNYSTNLIKGPPGTRVRLTVFSRGRARSLSIKREEISVPAAASRIQTRGGQKLMDLRLSTFSSGVHGEARQEIDRRLKQGAKGIVLDLRGNGGGLLTEARLVGSIFVPQGTIVVTRSRSRGEKTYRATGSAIPRDIPVVALVDRATASASEIVAGALQDTHRAEVVGTRTFGKGVFQEVVELPNKGALEITVGEFFLPGGRNLGGGGVKRGAGIRPDVQAVDKPGTKRDEALEAAYSELLKKL